MYSSKKISKADFHVIYSSQILRSSLERMAGFTYAGCSWMLFYCDGWPGHTLDCLLKKKWDLRMHLCRRKQWYTAAELVDSLRSWHKSYEFHNILYYYYYYTKLCVCLFVCFNTPVWHHSRKHIHQTLTLKTNNKFD